MQHGRALHVRALRLELEYTHMSDTQEAQIGTVADDKSKTTGSDYTKYLEKMTPFQRFLVWQAAHGAGLVPDAPISEAIQDGDELTMMIDTLQVAQATQLLMACASIADKENAPRILEILMSRPMTTHEANTARRSGSRPASTPGAKAPAGPRPAAPAMDDPRVITKVIPNPKKPSGASYARYALYQRGMTVAEFLRAGGIRGDIQHDVSKDFITISEAHTEEAKEARREYMESQSSSEQPADAG